jgi:hypothetical protein
MVVIMRSTDTGLEDIEGTEEKPVFTETEVAALVEEMRAKCEEIARSRVPVKCVFSLTESELACLVIADQIAKLKCPS